jgi:hypothetical protein
MRWFKKWGWVGGILAIALIVGWKEKRCQSQAYECRANYAAQVQSTRLAGNISVDQQASQDQATAAACEPKSYFCRLFSAANLPTMLLVFVGIGATWAALRTLTAIETQGGLMERQAKATEEAARAATKTIDIMVSKERARIQVEPGTVEIYPPDHPLPLDRVAYRVRCHGTTPATITETKVWAQISDSENPHRGGSYNSIYIPSVFIPTAEGVSGQTPLIYADELAFNRADVREKVHTKQMLVHFSGQIRYKDIFDKRWMYTFRYIYVPNPVAGTQGAWVKHGPPNDNTEIELASPN